MGASRDFTTGTTSARTQRSSTALLERAPRTGSSRERGAQDRVQGRTRETRRPTLTAPAPLRRPVEPERTPVGPSRLGSRQVVSVRGRRTQPIKSARTISRISVIAVTLLIGGIAVAMWLSGIATQQTFRIDSLVSQESQLSNQLETLNRDLGNASSSAELARKAHDMGMVVPDQPGILTVEENGDITESRAADTKSSPMIDINGAQNQPGQASSDPNETKELNNNLQAVPQGQQLPATGNQAATPGVAPYSNRSTNPGQEAPAAPAADAAPAAAQPAAPAPQATN